VFEDKALADQAVKAVEKEVNESHEHGGEKAHATTIERSL
jgi:hypothetical protein